MGELLRQGGGLMALLLGSGLAATIIFALRLFHLHRAQIRAGDFLDGIVNVVRGGNLVEAVSLCDETPGPVARIVRAALLRRDEPLEAQVAAMETAGRMEIARLETGIGALATIAQTAPILGLLGTILGLLDGLGQLRAAAPLAHAGDLAAGLRHALLTTAAGLAVAAAAFVFHNTLVGRVAAIVRDMEFAAAELPVRLRRVGAEGRP